MKFLSIIWMFLVMSVFPMFGQSPEELPLFSMPQLTYEGAFRISSHSNGVSNLNYNQGPIAYNYENHSLYIVGHSHHQAIAEYAIPEIIKSETLSELNMVETPIQVFSSVLTKTNDGNPQKINSVGGMYYVNHGGQAKLIVNGYEYYDAPADNTMTTVIIEDANAIETSPVSGYYSFKGGAGHTSGWISPVPEAWKEALEGSHITGQSSGIPIISRASVGPSAFSFEMSDALNAVTSIETNTLLDFSLSNPLNKDLSNESKTNNIWTHLSRATYGFIVPGTRTYLTLGNSGGHESGVCYKCTQDNGNLCGGYCPPVASDRYQYYWLWDMNDLMAVKNGTLKAYEVMPYNHGLFESPFQETGNKGIGGGSFDPSTGNLYLTIQSGDMEQGTYSNPPVVAVYNTNGSVSENEILEHVEVTMYPNPTSDILNIEGMVSESVIQITDMNGKQVKSITTSKSSYPFDMSSLSEGMYVVSVRNVAKFTVHTEKVLKVD
ncbi:T9SS type A sorting domain-containing protein [Zobellia uliginosa]|uniref:T9SS type A sorting domain-containing protein n=1 Tax=Zobellia uliginosa TaxID=143224 RepID=UPI001C07C49A|nr:T9SS type A sorting domain-containing protein [Zobellia uliginosa]MBU2946536.1 T9SS type A sorting domain-containing protein [Zobellia uliginosa]